MSINISKRLSVICDMIPPCDVLCDIGTDHGYVPCKCVLEGKAKSAIAMDINKGPLLKAKENVEKYELSDKIDLRLGSGMNKLMPQEADVIVIAGMGGHLMQDIISADKDKLKSDGIMLLQPQSEIPEFRRFLHNNGISIIDEQFIFDEGKYYWAMLCKMGEEHYDDELFYMFGKAPLERREILLKDYLLIKKDSLDSIKSNLKKSGSCKAAGRMLEIDNELSVIERALIYYED